MPSTGNNLRSPGILNPSFSIVLGNWLADIFCGSNSMVATSAAKLTWTESTPSSSPTFFSIRAEQLAQLMPLTGRVIFSLFMDL